MIAKKIPMRQKNLSSFEGLVNYISSTQGVDNRIGKVEMHNYESNDLQWAIQETLSVQDQNKRSEADKTYHLMVSFATDEYVDDEQLSRIEQSMIDALGYAEHQRVSVVHRDTDNLHFHVAINKVHPEKKTIHEPYNDFKILGKECRRFEDELGLKKVKRGGRKNQSIDMEEVAGIESLIGWVRRECGEYIKQAQTWNEVHELLGKHGLQIKLRGNGLVIGNGELYVKASSVDRGFSKKSLENRLGVFSQNESIDSVELKKSYREKPISTVNVDLLFKQYQTEKEAQKAFRQSHFYNLAEERKKKIESIKLKYAFRRNLIKHSGIGIAKKLLYKMLYRQMQNEMKAVRADYTKRRTQFFETNKSLAWADWLKRQATDGNVEALEALRRRGKKIANRGNRFIGAENTSYADLRVDTVTKKGTVVYAEEAMVIRDSGSILKLAAIPDDKAVLRALEIALKRYGDVLHIDGTQQFRDKVARVAAARNMQVVFSDQNLNQRYQQYLKEYEYVREHTDRHGIANGIRSDHGERQSSNGYLKQQRAVGNRPKRYRWHRYEQGRNRSLYAGLSGRANQELANLGGTGTRREQETSARSNGMRGMSERGLVRNQRGTQVLLSGNVPHNMEQPRASGNPVVRWTIHRPRRVGTLKDIQEIQAIVGTVAKPGVKPPSFRRNALSQLKYLPVVGIGQKKPIKEAESFSSNMAQELVEENMLPIEKYIYERQDKIKKGFNIMNHRQYNPTDTGSALFKGLRNVDGQSLLLFQLKDAEEIVVMNITPYTARRLSKVKLDSEIKITHQGQVRVVKGRSI